MTAHHTATADPQDFESWFDLAPLASRYDNSVTLISAYKTCLNHGRTALKQQFDAGRDTQTLLLGRSWLVDQVLAHAWQLHLDDASELLALAAVGGYGRSELMPGSDIDLLLLPIGDDFTMGPAVALRCVEDLKPRLVVPLHYNTFPLIETDPEAFAESVRGAGVEARVLQPGEALEV